MKKQRTIRFRAKRIELDRWVYGQYFVTPLTDENSGTTPDKGWFFLTGEKRHCIVQDGVAFVIDLNTLGQSTGLFDKNNKEIFEDDFVDVVPVGSSRNSYKMQVEWSEQMEAEGGYEGIYTGFSFENYSDKCEVVGNIHEK